MVNISMFSERLRELIVENGINQSELARATGISNQAISNWVNGVSEPLISSAWRLAEYFNCSVDYLIGKSEE